MERRPQRKLTPAYKAKVVRMVRTSGKGIGQLAKELGLTEATIRGWVKQADLGEKRAPSPPLTSEERAEVARLRRELKTITIEREFLLRAAALLARSGQSD